MTSKEKCMTTARGHFKNAFVNFKRVNHLKGIYLAKKHEDATYGKDISPVRNVNKDVIKNHFSN